MRLYVDAPIGRVADWLMRATRWTAEYMDRAPEAWLDWSDRTRLTRRQASSDSLYASPNGPGPNNSSTPSAASAPPSRHSP